MIKVFVNNVEFPLIEYSLSINEQLNERATCQFNIKSDFYRSVEKSMPIEILDVNDNDEVLDVLFVGFVDSATHKDYYNQNVRIYTVKGKDLHYLIDKRVWVRGFVNETCGAIVKKMVDEVLSHEGITYTADSIQEGYNVPAISFSYKKCSEILNQLSELAGYVWFVDYNGVLHFKSAGINGEAPLVTDSVVKENSLVISNKNSQYRNKQYIKGANAVTNTITQTFKGDGVSQSFTLGYRLADKPKIYVNGDYIAEDDIVLKGYNETAKWYYEKDDAVILQNPNNTPLSSGSTLRVEYQGNYPIIAITESQSEIQRNYQLGCGTGLVEECDTETDINTLGTAISTAAGRLSKYGGNSYQVTFTTLEKGYDVGQKLSFQTSEWNDDDYVVDSIEIIDDLDFVWYKITAVKGALCDSWFRTLGNGLNFKPTMPIVDVSETETVVLNHSFDKTWVLNDNPNIMKVLFADGSVLANGEENPMFNYDQRVSFIEVIGKTGEVLWRNIKSIQTDPTKDVFYTYFYIDPFDAVGEWAKVRFYGGHQATFAHKSGILIDERDLNITKTQLEGVQIARTDRKGW